MLNAHARALTDRVVAPVGRGLARVGVTPNWLTFAGLVLTVTGMTVVLLGGRLAGAAVLAVGLLIDAVDGAVARARGSASQFGAFYDSVADRVGDAVVFAGLVWLVLPDPLLFAAGVTAWATASLTSYARAKAESLGWNATVGVIERPERMIIVVAGLVLDAVGPALAVLAVGGAVTVAQRVAVVWRQAGRPGFARGSRR